MMVFVGYLTVFAYVFFLIFVLGNIIKSHSNVETSRKAIHIGLFMVWVFIDVFFKNTIHQVIVPICFLVLNTLSYRFGFFKSIEREEDNHAGIIHFAIAVTTIMLISFINRDFYNASGVAVACLTFGDGFAALIGYNLNSKKIKDQKSVAGFAACIAASAIGLMLYKIFYCPMLTLRMILLISLVSGIMELSSGEIDNYFVSLSTFGLSWMLWNLQTPDILSAVSWAVLIFFTVYFTHAITYCGSIIAMIMVGVFRYVGGGLSLAYLLITYFSIFIIGMVRKKKTQIQKLNNSHRRNAFQILINGGIGTLCMLLYGIKQQRLFLLLSVTAIGGCFIDSISSDVGGFSKQEPYDFLRHKYVPSGISGGITVLGTTTAAIFSVFISMFTFIFFRVQYNTAIAVGMFIFLQSVIDTVLGSLLQVKYKCKICGLVSEEKIHCGLSTSYNAGVKWIDNNMVNLISSIIVTAIAASVLAGMK